MSRADYREPEWVSQVRDAVDIVDIISEYTPLKRSGKTFRGPCPLHGGKKANFSVVPSKGIFKCFVCGEAGNVFTFLMKKTGQGFYTVARELASRYGIYIPSNQSYRKELSEDEARRRGVQKDLVGEGAPSVWEKLGIREAVPVFRLGVKEGAQSACMLPVWGDDDTNAPGGWLTYEVQDSSPIARGFDSLSKKGLDGTLFSSRSGLRYADQEVLLFVVDPIVAVRLHEAGYYRACSVAGNYRSPDSAWLTEAHVNLLLERAKGRVEQVGLVVPMRDRDRKRQTLLLRALYATEIALLSAGVQPYVVDLKEEGSSLYGWQWASRMHSESDVRECLAQQDLVLDVFELRVRMLAAMMKKGAVDASQAIDKLLPSLRAVHGSNKMLFEAYTAWCVRILGLDRVLLEGAVVDGQDRHGGAEVF